MLRNHCFVKFLFVSLWITIKPLQNFHLCLYAIIKNLFRVIPLFILREHIVKISPAMKAVECAEKHRRRHLDALIRFNSIELVLVADILAPYTLFRPVAYLYRTVPSNKPIAHLRRLLAHEIQLGFALLDQRSVYKAIPYAVLRSTPQVP